jgi:hypothetical protein
MKTALTDQAQSNDEEEDEDGNNYRKHLHCISHILGPALSSLHLHISPFSAHYNLMKESYDQLFAGKLTPKVSQVESGKLESEPRQCG